MALTQNLCVVLSLSVLFALLTIRANARPGVHFHPCKTLIISYTISSFKPHLDSFTLPQNPNFPSKSDENPTGFLAIVRQFNEFESNSKPSFFHSSEIINRHHFDRPIIHDEKREIHPHHPFGSFGVSSLRERTKDILSVVVALLFGVGCGALTSATMYLAWSLITNRYEIRNLEADDYDALDEDDDITAIKMGFVKIPAAAPASPVPAPAKDVP